MTEAVATVLTLYATVQEIPDTLKRNGENR